MEEGSPFPLQGPGTEAQQQPFGNSDMTSKLEQLRAMTTVVADTGDIEAVRRAQGAGFVVSDNYGHAALLALLLPRTTPVYGLEDRWRLFALPHDPPAATVGILVRSARRDEAPAADWTRLTRLGTIDRARHGMVAETFRLYRVEGRAGDTPIAAMPRPR